MLLCDGDTWFVKHPKSAFARIRPGHAVMHVAEHHLSDPCARPLADALAGHTFQDRAGSVWGIGGATVMFNAGVIGLHESEMAVLDEVLHLTDQMYVHARFPTIEQLAFSVCLRHYTRLGQSYDVIHHYWPPTHRARFRDQLSRILHERPVPSREAQFEKLLPWAPRLLVRPFHLGAPSSARQLTRQTRALLSRAADFAHVKGALRRVRAQMQRR